MLFNSNKANVIEAIIYLGLLTWTAYCVVQAFKDYSEGKTYFSKSFEYVSDSDIPSKHSRAESRHSQQMLFSVCFYREALRMCQCLMTNVIDSCSVFYAT